jgi:hypothetical protein
MVFLIGDGAEIKDIAKTKVILVRVWHSRSLRDLNKNNLRKILLIMV